LRFKIYGRWWWRVQVEVCLSSFLCAVVYKKSVHACARGPTRWFLRPCLLPSSRQCTVHSNVTYAPLCTGYSVTADVLPTSHSNFQLPTAHSRARDCPCTGVPLISWDQNMTIPKLAAELPCRGVRRHKQPSKDRQKLKAGAACGVAQQVARDQAARVVPVAHVEPAPLQRVVQIIVEVLEGPTHWCTCGRGSSGVGAVGC